MSALTIYQQQVVRLTAKARAWVSGLTARERALGAAMVCAFAIALCVEAGGFVSRSREAAFEARTQLARLERTRRVERTPVFVAAMDSGARAARAGSTGGETIYIARARAQAEVEGAAAAAGVGEMSVRLRDRPKTFAVVEPIVLNVEGDFDRETFAAFLLALSQTDVSLTPLAVDVVEREDASRFRMDLEAYALTTETAS